MRVGVLASGEGTNLQALLDTVHGGGVEIVAVASDQPGARALERAAGAGVATRVFERGAFADRPARDAAIADWLEERDVGLVVLAGYMAILDDAFLARFAGRIVNVHPSLLPAFPGVRGDRAGARLRREGLRRDRPLRRAGRGGQRAGDPAGGGRGRRTRVAPADVLAAIRPLEHALLPRAVALIAAGAVRRDPDHPRRVLVTPGGGA